MLISAFQGACSRNATFEGRTSAVLLLSQAQFTQVKGEDGKNRPLPGAAKLMLVYHTSGGWRTENIEDPESNVFHKALPFEDGILTIGANAAVLKLWKRVNGTWVGETLWKTSFGGEHNRLRDIEYADVTGDGRGDLIVATHDQGVVAVLEKNNNVWVATEVSRSPRTFVHEIEAGDVNGDGIKEFFATPSAPNKVDGTPQPGSIVMYRYNGTSFESSLVEEFPKRHVKEILVADVEGNGFPDLFAALEAEMTKEGGQQRVVDTVKIKRYRFDKGTFAESVIADLPDVLCRFLSAGDVTGDGSIDIVASTFRSGLWLLKKNQETWDKELIDGDSSGFEHATLIADLDNNGIGEIYVAADDQRVLRKYQWDGRQFKREDIIALDPDTITFNVNALP